MQLITELHEQLWYHLSLQKLQLDLDQTLFEAVDFGIEHSNPLPPQLSRLSEQRGNRISSESLPSVSL